MKTVSVFCQINKCSSFATKQNNKDRRRRWTTKCFGFSEEEEKEGREKFGRMSVKVSCLKPQICYLKNKIQMGLKIR